MTKNKEFTTMQISRETLDELAKLGSKSDTYENIITRLIESYKKMHKKD